MASTENRVSRTPLLELDVSWAQGGGVCYFTLFIIEGQRISIGTHMYIAVILGVVI